MEKGTGKATSPGSTLPSRMCKLPKQGKKVNYPSQEESDKAYRESREWLAEHGQEFARDSLGIPKPKVNGGGAEGTEKYKAYREAREWLTKFGNETAKEEVQDVGKLVKQVGKLTPKAAKEVVNFLTDQAAAAGAEYLTKRQFGEIGGTLLKRFNFLTTVISIVLSPTEAHAPTDVPPPPDIRINGHETTGR